MAVDNLKRLALAFKNPSRYWVLPLSRGAIALVDFADLEWLSAFSWCVRLCRSGAFYANRGTTVGGKSVAIQLHREIMRAPAGLVVDHINGDTLDCRRENLRICTRAQNTWNQKPRVGCASKYRGVIRDKYKWRAQIKMGSRNYYLGGFDSECAAAARYNVEARRLFGEFARLNLDEDGRPL